MQAFGVDFQAVRAVAVAALVDFAVAVVEEADVLLALVLVRALGLGAVAGGAGSEVVRVEEAQVLGLVIRPRVADQLVDADRGLAPLVAVHAQVRVRVAAVDDCAARELDLLDLVARELHQIVVARGALEAVRRRRRDVDAFAQERGQPVGRVALGARAGHGTLFVPVAERLFRTGEVARVDATHGRHVDRRRRSASFRLAIES